MKKLPLILLFSVILVNVNAQQSRIGIDAAFNTTWLFNKDVSDAGDELDMKTSFGAQFGAMALINFGKGMGLSTGVSYTQVNQRYTLRSLPNTPLEVTSETKTKLTYIDVPLLFRYTSKTGAYFEVGPQVGFLSAAKIVDSDDKEFDIKDGVNGVNISAQIGFGIDLKVSEKLMFMAGLRFGYGLTDAYKEQDGVQDYQPTHTGVGGLHLGLAYLIGK